jgi:hypothetical protein
MSKGPTRRQWFLGLIGAVLGAGAARAAARWLPGGVKAPPEPVWLVMTQRTPQGATCTLSQPVPGRAVVEYDSREGRIRVFLPGREGRLVEQPVAALESVSLFREVPVQPAEQGQCYVSGLTHSTYLGGAGFEPDDGGART